MPAGTTLTLHCAPWPDCPGGWADLDVLYFPEWGQAFVIAVHCLSEEACVVPTPTPGPIPTPGSTHTWPCDYPPTVDGGILHQPCDDWPGWFIDVEVCIPPAAVLRNPWPRGLVGLENRLWLQDVPDGVEKFSEEKALPCNVDYGTVFDDPWYDCGTETGTVGEGARVNYQLGAAWRHWTGDVGPVFGYTPPGEWGWVVQDREHNGGTKVFLDVNPLVYTFETSSWGLDPDGPTWNPECQDRECDCDERVLDYLGTESYHVNIETWWWPEWIFKWDEYVCAHQETVCEHWPGWGQAQCDLDDDGVKDPDTHLTVRCDGWKWVRRSGTLGYCEHQNPHTGWCMYDLRRLGATYPLVGWTGNVVAGADMNGNRCGSWTDRWPHYIPIPVIEIQPVKFEGQP